MNAICFTPSGEPAMRTSDEATANRWQEWGFVVRYINTSANVAVWRRPNGDTLGALLPNGAEASEYAGVGELVCVRPLSNYEAAAVQRMPRGQSGLVLWGK